MANLFSINRGASEGVQVTDFKRIKYADKPKVEKYYLQKLDEYGIVGVHPYSLNYMYNEMNGNNAHRIFVHTKNKDKIFLAMKRVDMFDIKYNRLIGLPISQKSDYVTVASTINELFDSGLIKEMYVPEHELGFMLHYDSMLEMFIDVEPVDFDYYTDIEERLPYISRSKYRSKHRINICERQGAEMRVLGFDDYTQVKQLHEQWVKGKEVDTSVHGGRMFSYFFKNYHKIVNDENLILLGLFYGEQLLGFTLFSKVLDGYAYQLMSQTYNVKTLETADDTLRKVLQDIGQVFYYYIVTKLHSLNIKGFTVAGAAGSKKLLQYKENMNTGVIKYYKCRRLNDEDN